LTIFLLKYAIQSLFWIKKLGVLRKRGSGTGSNQKGLDSIGYGTLSPPHLIFSGAPSGKKLYQLTFTPMHILSTTTYKLGKLAIFVSVNFDNINAHCINLNICVSTVYQCTNMSMLTTVHTYQFIYCSLYHDIIIYFLAGAST
jgi:hypothetical protein